MSIVVGAVAVAVAALAAAAAVPALRIAVAAAVHLPVRPVVAAVPVEDKGWMSVKK